MVTQLAARLIGENRVLSRKQLLPRLVAGAAGRRRRHIHEQAQLTRRRINRMLPG